MFLKLTISGLLTASMMISTSALAGSESEREDSGYHDKEGIHEHQCEYNYRNKLQILHSSDNESSFQDPNTLEEKILNYSAIAKGLKRVAKRECTPSLYLTAGDHTLPGPFYQASAEAFGEPGLGDILIYNAMGLAANGIGNHEFDGGINEFAQMIDMARYPFIAVNLDFSQVVVADGSPEIEIGKDGKRCAKSRGKVVKSCWVKRGEYKIGLIGRAPADFFNVIEDPINTLPGLDFVGGRDANNQPLVSAVGQVLEQVELLESKGINRIILLDHAQDFTADPLSASALRGIDIIVAAGSTGFMARPVADGPYNLLRPEDSAEADYPTWRVDSEGETVLVINSDQQYRYLGNLIVTFDKSGHIADVDMRSGPVATNEAGVEALNMELGARRLAPKKRVVSIYDAIRDTSIIQDAFFVVGTTDYPLNGFRADVRTRETNLGLLAADSTIWGAQQNGFPSVDIALKNGGGIRDTIQGPTIIRLAVEAALAFDNTLTVLQMSGDQVLAAMENSVSRADATDGRFPQIAGMVLEFDTANPPLEALASVTTPSRVRNLTITKHDGTVVNLVTDGVADTTALSDTFVLATNSFTATGGDGYAAFPASVVLGATSIGEQQILEEYIINVLGGNVSIMDDAANPMRVIRLP
ncbi:MAG: bifunctional metallophosphatase/5'-nucleotidase [Candidatus Thiodiazotropha taylori]|uniref:Bifunctional metallophosphatase/5'-nucleotidase n=1 Tax=Candidatus Thiodiazotropha taylori TaxID=2792791 RepID=A0A9E4N7Y8_9GAMM|nr:bifunctional metallophosphatase/5'-nucleotidase [Candidatus Thiodiazotropha taylori]MCW4259259.1 bifunctional metallophosphatase/5'-nucleotidase [Candidatus Thiodiazotropha taylori]